MRTMTSALARRLAITRQRLAGPAPATDAGSMLDVVRDLGCLQLDPISAVARSHLLVLFSRIGRYDPAELDRLLWRDRRLFEYWAHVASIVLTEDYPIHNWMMRRHGKESHAWLQQNRALRRHILDRLRRNGPTLSREFEDRAERGWYSTGWTTGRNVSIMLDYLWLQGKIMVAGRSGLQKLWDLSERCLPEWTPREKLSEREVVRRAAQRSLRALGVAKPRHIALHFTRGRYPDLKRVLSDLEAEGKIERVTIRGWPDEWFIHVDDLPLLEQLERGDWQPRTTLLSPFDNLICDRARTLLMFDFDFTIEIYVPAAKRKYGYYVLPILHGDRFVGRIDSKMDRAKGALTVNAVYAEAGAPDGRGVGRAIARSIEELAGFLGAKDITYDRKRVPQKWKRDLLG